MLFVDHPNSSPTANYTLPGVINYLTSEFTNLERFKIVTNLERAEMSYKITRYESEINSLRFINDRQSKQIEQLEAEIRRLKADGTENSESLRDGYSSHEASRAESRSETSAREDAFEGEKSFKSEFSKGETSKNGKTRDGKPKQGSKDSSHEINDRIPHVDLLVIKRSRERLAKTIQEVTDLIQNPIAESLHQARETAPTYDVLFQPEPKEMDNKSIFSDQLDNEDKKVSVSDIFQSMNEVSIESDAETIDGQERL